MFFAIFELIKFMCFG